MLISQTLQYPGERVLKPIAGVSNDLTEYRDT